MAAISEGILGVSVDLLDLVGGHGSCGSTPDRSNIVSRCGSRSRLTYLPLCDPHTPSLTLRLIGIWDLKNLAFEFLCQGWPIYEKYPNNLNFFYDRI